MTELRRHHKHAPAVGSHNTHNTARTWMNEPSVWCSSCRNFRFVSHADEHAAAVQAGGFVPGVTSQPGSPFGSGPAYR